jgi:hypothetical protein
MNPTEKARFAAQIFFADLLLPLKRSNMRSNVNYLELTPCAETYWRACSSRNGGISKASEYTAPSLLENLGSYWATQPDRNLPRLIPFLAALREEVISCSPDKAGDESSPPEFVYPLF